MCQRNSSIQLCTCSEQTIESIQKIYAEEINALGKKELLQVIRWKLSKYVGTQATGMDGMIIMPSGQLTKELTSSFVISQLNQTNCFDFEYTPQEGDCLILEVGWLFNRRGKHIKNKERYSYMSFIFREQQWLADSYDVFYEKTAVIQEGILRVISCPMN